ncbi:MAG TPA: prephenate dehydrogenase/arogenate dehydrogenase family protein [Acidimicrobiales bacterium]|nr:prephenate dehydrogenase/arogenate dehydrogenase family protein [Acidimicrobiales bacterium]
MTTSPTEVGATPSPLSASTGNGPATAPGRAMIFGTGLIGGSVGMALRDKGWHVSGVDAAPGVAARAVSLGALSAEGEDTDAELVVVATPVHAAAAIITEYLGRPGRRPDVIVTDVGSVKGPLVAAVDHPSFVGGHPMAGSEQVGVEGASADLFVGATWVLTPTALTDPTAYTRVRSVLADMGAVVVALAPAQHDALVAVVSHVPHLAAATLMDLASNLGEEHAALLQLAAGGFRDMTRIAAGQPNIWPDICDDNADAIVETLDLLVDALRDMRRRVADHDRDSLLDVLGRAAVARRALAVRTPQAEELVEVRVPVPDRPKVLAEITTLAAELGVNIVDLEIAHSVEGDRGVMLLVIAEGATATLQAALADRGYRSTYAPVGPGR